uniref:Uncharacterized protein n=1 Tax=Physcomitrium patens TaxID=3218 RepID=A0A2K1KKF0_PHYPA|nr:hypothetical protein PHYPA_007922 [Physcomitrium patens]
MLVPSSMDVGVRFLPLGAIGQGQTLQCTLTRPAALTNCCTCSDSVCFFHEIEIVGSDHSPCLVHRWLIHSCTGQRIFVGPGNSFGQPCGKSGPLRLWKSPWKCPPLGKPR